MEGLQHLLDGSQNVFMLEYPCDSPDTQRWFLMYATPMPKEFGGVVISHINITERKQAEDRNKNFIQALHQKNQDLKDFAYMVSHDLQEPLRKISAFGDRLETRIPNSDEVGRNYLDRILKSTSRMQALIDNLIQLTQVETEAKSFKATDLKKVAKEVLEDLGMRINETGGRVTIKSLPTIEADPVQMHQLLQNLISNALKYHKEGVSPIVNLSGTYKNNGMWEIRVEDNGIGIDEQHVDQIFKPFERLHGRSAYEGTGIGLAICNKVVNRHRGTISVQKNSQNGATFLILLPEKQIETSL